MNVDPGTDAARRLLSRLSETLSASVDAREVLQRMAELAVPTLGDWCSIDVVRDDGTFARLAVAHPDPELVALAHEMWTRYPPSPDDPTGLPAVVRTGRSEMTEHIPDEAIVAGSRDPWQLDVLRRLGLSGASYVVVPIRGNGRVLGALTLVQTRPGHETPELALAEEFGRIAAVAVENARLFEEVSTARAPRRASARSARSSTTCRSSPGPPRPTAPSTSTTRAGSGPTSTSTTCGPPGRWRRRWPSSAGRPPIASWSSRRGLPPSRPITSARVAEGVPADESEFYRLAREKMTRVLGAPNGPRRLEEILKIQDNPLGTADDSYWSATELARRQAFEGAVGGMLQVAALMRGARPRKQP